MGSKQEFLALCVLLCVGASAPANAQSVYKCWSRGMVTYTELACSGSIVDTDQAPVTNRRSAQEADRRRMEQNRVAARAMRPGAGESAAAFESRRRRARLMATDRDECARLDTRMPVDEARLKSPDQEEVLQAEAALGASRKRFRQIRC